jgi:hypothetical protein
VVNQSQAKSVTLRQLLLLLLTLTAMNHSSELWGLSLALGGFLVGSLSHVLTAALSRYLSKREPSGPVVIKRKTTGEFATIPDHYDSEAVDALIRQLRKSDKIPA